MGARLERSPRREAGLGGYSNSIVVGSSNPHTWNRPVIQVSHGFERPFSRLR